MAWDKKTESWMPLLDRALGEIIRGWVDLVMNNGLCWASKDIDKEKDSPTAVSEFLLQIAERQRTSTTKLPIEAKGRELFIQENLVQEATKLANRDALGKYLRNAFQYSIHSPTITRELTPAGEVVILGAGASAHAGIPLTEKLFDDIKSELKTKCPSSDAFLSLRSQPWNWAWSGNDMEDLLSALQAMSWTHWAYQAPKPPEDEHIAQLLCACRSVIISRQSDPPKELVCSIGGCKHKTLVTPEEITTSFLDKVHDCAATHGSNRWAIISFNQDTVVETQAYAKGERFWSWKNGYGYIVTGSGLSPYDPIHDHRIYKPHGTVAWYRENQNFPQFGACKVEVKTLDKTDLALAHCAWKDKLETDKPPLILVPSFFKDYGRQDHLGHNCEG